MTNWWSLPTFLPLLSPPSAGMSQSLLAKPAFLSRFLTGLGWETALTSPTSFPFWPQALTQTENFVFSRSEGEQRAGAGGGGTDGWDTQVGS